MLKYKYKLFYSGEGMDQHEQQQQNTTPPRDTSLAKTRKFLLAKKPITLGIAVAVVAGSLSVGALIRDQHNANQANSRNDPNALLENLEYQTVLPQGRSIDQLGGWQRVSPDEKAPVYAYTDTIDEVPISVSQQPIPDKFRGDTDAQVAELARKFSATTKLSVDDLTLYVGTSTKGPQSAIVAKNNLLILIKSQKKIDNKSWTRYVQSLN